ncbi:UDP-galactose transporter Gms1 [Thecaphora frezii]
MASIAEGAGAGEARYFGLSLKNLSLLTLVLQNTALGVVMHHSRVSAPAGQGYFFPTAVLLTELLKCLVSFGFALFTSDDAATVTSSSDSHLPIAHRAHQYHPHQHHHSSSQHHYPSHLHQPSRCVQPRRQRKPSFRRATSPVADVRARFASVMAELTTHDGWKLAIPALLYVLQNNLQFVAVSNLEPPVFICAYQLKILTTAMFSILLLRRRLGAWQWASLAMLALGVAVVQLQSQSVSGLVPFDVQTHGYGHVSAGPAANSPPPPPPPPFDAHGALPPDHHASLRFGLDGLSRDDTGSGSGGGFWGSSGSGLTSASRIASLFDLHGPSAPTAHERLPPSSPSFPNMRISMSMEESSRLAQTLEPVKGFLAVLAACFTSGLAGVYFELLLKTSTCNLWTRNVQLSAWSLIPAALPVVARALSHGATAPFQHFGAGAWATVLLQVTGGLAVALVIKHADNILKGFAVSFSILLSFAISVSFYHFPLTAGFMMGAALVILSTVSYSHGSNLSSGKPSAAAAVAETARSYNVLVSVPDKEERSTRIEFE